MDRPKRTLPDEFGQERHSPLPPHAPSYDEKALEAFIEHGGKAWADIPDAVAWVRELRGGADD